MCEREKKNKLGLSCAKLRLNWASQPVSILSKYFSQIPLRFKFLININIVLILRKQAAIKSYLSLRSSSLEFVFHILKIEIFLKKLVD